MPTKSGEVSFFDVFCKEEWDAKRGLGYDSDATEIIPPSPPVLKRSFSVRQIPIVKAPNSTPNEEKEPPKKKVKATPKKVFVPWSEQIAALGKRVDGVEGECNAMDRRLGIIVKCIDNKLHEVEKRMKDVEAIAKAKSENRYFDLTVNMKE